MLELEGRENEFFCERIVLAALTKRKLQINRIRETEGGLVDSEVEFLRIISEISNGAEVYIDPSGTLVRFSPGVLHGAERMEIRCGNERGITYYLLPLLCLLAFAKGESNLLFTGITNGGYSGAAEDISVDAVRLVCLPLLNDLLNETGFHASLKIKRREMPQEADEIAAGVVTLRINPARTPLVAVYRIDEGKVKRIRGICYGLNVSMSLLKRSIYHARGYFNDFIPDVNISMDMCSAKKKDSGESHGYGLMIFSESTENTVKFAEGVADTPEAEQLGEAVAKVLLGEISRRGVIPSKFQFLVFLLMAATDGGVSQVRMGKLTDHTTSFLRHLKEFMGIKFKLAEDKKNGSVLASCIGVGHLFGLNEKKLAY